MFREMRRKRQLLPQEEALAILTRASSGVLAAAGDGGYPYAVPLSFVYREGKLYFHCAKSGHKLDALRRCPKASFCVVDQDQVVPEKYTTLYRSVVAFGTVRILTEEAEIRRAAACLGEKYNPGGEGLQQEIDREFPALCMLEFTIEHLTGKEGRELARLREEKNPE